MQQLKLQIDGMGCGSCVWKVTSALSALPGVRVEKVKVGSAAVHLDPARVTEETLVGALAEVGFTARKEASHENAAHHNVGGAHCH